MYNETRPMAAATPTGNLSRPKGMSALLHKVSHGRHCHQLTRQIFEAPPEYPPRKKNSKKPDATDDPTPGHISTGSQGVG